MIKIDEEYIKSLPLVTNKLNIEWDREAFFAKYAVVSYYSKEEAHNLPYEHLADTECLSVTGIRSRWDELPTVRFFVLCEKGKERTVVESLRKYDDVAATIDTLDTYTDKQVRRIVASLAINTLGKKKNGAMMYNGGALLICDDDNFGVKPSRKELVALRIEVNEYLHLTAKTNTFSNPCDGKELMRYRNCVFALSKDVDGHMWSGKCIKPVVVKMRPTNGFNREKYFIKKKRFPGNNIVPYWPYNSAKYTHGRLFAITEVVGLVNERFSPMVSLSFAEEKVEYYDACKTGKDMENYLYEALDGKTLFIDDPFMTDGSKAFADCLREEIVKQMGDRITFTDKDCDNDNSMVVRLCEPIPEDKEPNIFYGDAMDRLYRMNSPLQHLVYDEEAEKNSVNNATARRILTELLVKDCLVKKRMSVELAAMAQGWQFLRYKVRDGLVVGAAMSVDPSQKIEIKHFGTDSDWYGKEYETFCREWLHFDKPELINGSSDYMAMKKDGNVYLIINTEQIPILDTKLIDDAYGKIVNEGEKLSIFKRKAVAHDYLRGYIGLHMWRTEGLYGEENGAYSYISGYNSDLIKMGKEDPKNTAKMDKMPRARRIFVLHADHPDAVEADIMHIMSMLRYGFGRWNELMTYPFMFKFLGEYLEHTCYLYHAKHWDKV